MLSKTHCSHFIPLIENISVSKDDLIEQIKDLIAESSDSGKVQYLSYGGLFDIIVYPSGRFTLIPFNQMKTYELDGEYFQEV